MTRDPDCPMALDPRTAAATVEHTGRGYYFRSEGCMVRVGMKPPPRAPVYLLKPLCAFRSSA